MALKYDEWIEEIARQEGVKAEQVELIATLKPKRAVAKNATV